MHLLLSSSNALNASAYFPGPSPAASGDPAEVGDRSTTFQPVEGGTEHRSGETLLVAAYAGLWLLLLGWVLLQWMKQTALARRLDDLEALLDAASPETAKATANATPAKKAPPARA